MLKLSQMVLPKHTFYVDNIYVYYPLPYVRKIYYLDVDFIGILLDVTTSRSMKKYDCQSRSTDLCDKIYD